MGLSSWRFFLTIKQTKRWIERNDLNCYFLIKIQENIHKKNTKEGLLSFTRVFQGEAVSLEPIVGPVLIEMNEQDEGVEVAQVHGEHQAPYPPDKRIG